MPLCRCHSRRAEHRCCGPLHDGKQASTPLLLMRSRYAAFAKGLVDYLIATTCPDGPQFEADRAAWAASLAAHCRATRFVGLDILDAPAPESDFGEVTFRAHLVQGGRRFSFIERSAFRRTEGRWRYVGPLEPREASQAPGPAAPG